MTAVPAVTVLIPARDEERDIERCLDAVLAQDHPHDRLEVIVVDGGSRDRTAELARRRLAASQVRGGVVSNPAATTPSNLNAGLRAASGTYVCRVDARSLVPPHYVRRCVELLAGHPDLRVVGGRQEARSRPHAGLVARSIARGLNNRWGSGLARYRRGAASGPTDTVYLGAFRTEELRQVGGWNEDLPTNQDFDLNRRLGAFGTVWFDDRLVVGYLPRERWQDVARQYFRFGRWKVRYWRLAGSRPNARQAFLLVMPPALVSGGLFALRRCPILGLSVPVLGALALDLTGAPDPAPLLERLGGVATVGLVALSWWSGVVHEWVTGG